ncbi:Retrovirus-related Pol polyprotein [Stylophora pistillata]|uniref:Retrovirus-related Pol polyprotein n=1 Tax=Stylophora pistillata TaxID=50429 RepID=A0A2B4RBY5_STYPI|nr:Retrovirus-related Pol polyprotein [Stylophora pistillata]
MEVYLAASAASEKDGNVQTAIILNCAGPQVLEVYDNIICLNAKDKHKPDKVLEALENYCNPRDNEVLDSHTFWNTPYQEPFDLFPYGAQNESRVLQLSAAKVNKVAQKPGPRVPRNNKPEGGNRHVKKNNEVSQSPSGKDDHDDRWLMAVSHKEDSIIAILTLNDHDVRFQLDNTADVNTICQIHIRKYQVSLITVCLNMWNKTNLKPLGEAVLRVVNPRTKEESDVKSIVVPNGFINLLGLKTTKALGFITINEECFISLINIPRLGDLGAATLQIDKNVQLKVLPCRNIPLAIENAMKEELDQLVEKDKESSKLTTMITPFGRYQWMTLPFGLQLSSEIFQCKLDEALGGLEGVFSVIDDIVIAGYGVTVEEAQINNQRKLTEPSKGHRITKDGIKIDEAKLQAISNMTAPTDVAGVKRLCGMENLSESPCLGYFGDSKEVVIQVDSSKHGIAAVQLQEGRPVEYALRALTPSERNWAQIEKEALSVLYGIEKFHQYKHGSPVKVENDHNPLAAILRKPLSQTPKRLQDIIMQYQRYGFHFAFVKGTDLLIADTLSRAHQNNSRNDQDDRARIMNVNVFGDILDKRLDEIRDMTSCDSSLQAVMKLVLEGWPADKRQTPVCALPYFNMQDCLSVVDGILVKGKVVVIPMALRPSIKRRLHSAHLGHDSMLRQARGTVYWPNMTSDIKQIANMCETCQGMKPRNSPEPLKQDMQ